MIAEYPYAVLLAMMTLVIISGLFSFVPELNAPDLPDFSTPVMVRWQRPFQVSIPNCLNCVHYCDDHSSLDFKSAVQYMKHFIYHFTDWILLANY